VGSVDTKGRCPHFPQARRRTQDSRQKKQVGHSIGAYAVNFWQAAKISPMTFSTRWPCCLMTIGRARRSDGRERTRSRVERPAPLPVLAVAVTTAPAWLQRAGLGLTSWGRGPAAGSGGARAEDVNVAYASAEVTLPSPSRGADRSAGTDPGPGWERIGRPPSSLPEHHPRHLVQRNAEEPLMESMGPKALAYRRRGAYWRKPGERRDLCCMA
jgi:hypothetical protein